MRPHGPAARSQALDIYREQGLAAASRATGVPKSTIHRWAHETRTPWPVERAADQNRTAAATAAAVDGMELRRAQLADRLLVEAGRLLDQLWTPTVDRRVVVRSTGPGVQVADVVDVHRPQPTAADQVRIMTAVAIAVDKVHVLTGHAAADGPTQPTGDAERVAAQVITLVRGGRE